MVDLEVDIDPVVVDIDLGVVGIVLGEELLDTVAEVHLGILEEEPVGEDIGRILVGVEQLGSQVVEEVGHIVASALDMVTVANLGSLMVQREHSEQLYPKLVRQPFAG